MEGARPACQRARDSVCCGRGHCSSRHWDCTVLQASQCRLTVHPVGSVQCVSDRGISSGGWFGSCWAGIQTGKYSHARHFDIFSWCFHHNGPSPPLQMSAPFKIATLYHWVVVVTSRAPVEEPQHTREDEFSLRLAINEMRGTFLYS